MRGRAFTAVAVLLATLAGALILGPERAWGVAVVGYFIDDNGRILEADIDAIAAAGITRGCNPPVNDRFCPTNNLTRGEMAAFLRRALQLPAASQDYFTDDNGSIFEADINAIAAAGITRGCNPPANDRYCPNDLVTREQMAAFIRRALGLPFVTLYLPMAAGQGIQCNKSPSECRVTYDVVAGRSYTIREGHFLVEPSTSSESNAFNNSATRIEITVNGSTQTVSSLPQTVEDGFRYRMWSRNLSFPPGQHTMVVTWSWNGEVTRRTVATVRAN